MKPDLRQIVDTTYVQGATFLTLSFKVLLGELSWEFQCILNFSGESVCTVNEEKIFIIPKGFYKPPSKYTREVNLVTWKILDLIWPNL
jgi:hypothetical protein